jgi:hypothetical protein
MKNKTVTAELKKSIQKVTKQTNLHVFSDCRLNKQAVGVKVIQSNYSNPEIYSIVSDMENKGFKLAYTKFNEGGNYGGYFSGTRFCFYKLSN